MLSFTFCLRWFYQIKDYLKCGHIRFEGNFCNELISASTKRFALRHEMRHLLGATAVEESAARISMRPSFTYCACGCVCVRIAAECGEHFMLRSLFIFGTAGHRQRVKNNE